MLDGVNKICAQCQRECKQFAQMELVNCPKFKPISRVTIGKDGIIRAREKLVGTKS